MGLKYSTTSSSGFNNSPPSDDGQQIPSNEMQWQDVKEKIGDPLKTFTELVDSKLVAHVNEEVVDKAIAFTTTTAEHKKTINVTALATQSLGDAATMAIGYIVIIKNSHSATNTVGRATGGDTIDGIAGDVTLAPGQASAFVINAGADGYLQLDTNDFDVMTINTTLNMPAGTVDTAELAADAVDDTKLADNAVGSEHLQSDAVILQLQTEIATTSGTTHTFSSIPSWVKRVTIMLTGVSTDGTGALRIRIGDAGGIESTGYNSRASDGATNLGSTTGFLFTQSVAAITNTRGVMVLTLQNSTNHVWIASSNADISSGSVHVGAGEKTLDTALTQLELNTVGGDTFDAGAINIIWE